MPRCGASFARQRKWLKRKADARVRAVARVLCRHDPEGLIEIGAPADEYDYEAQQIAARLPRAKSEDESRRLAVDVFQRAFDRDYPADDPTFRAIARDLWSLKDEE